MKKNKIFMTIVLGAVILTSIFTTPTFVYGEDGISYSVCESTAKAMCVIEQSSGRVLYGKNINKKLPMASTTKVFTALTVLENCDNLESVVDVDNRAVGIEGTSIYLRKNEHLTVKELLLGMMLPSGNDAATALAYYIGGDIPTFCKMMTICAENAGAYNSSFKNPHGLDEKGHYTTAYDLAKVSAKALENPIFYEISTTKSAVISGNNEVKSRYLKNKNRLLKTFDGCNGVKTGFTDNAGRCFVSSAKRDNMTIVCSVLNCGNMFEECAKFMQLSFDNYKLREILPDYNFLDEIQVEKGRKDIVKVFSRKKFTYPLTEEENLKLNYVVDVPDKIIAPIEKEKVVGKIQVYLEDNLLFEDNILTRDEVRKNNFLSYVKDVIHFWR